MVEKERVKTLNNHKSNTAGNFVLYFVQASPRIKYNQALIYAINRANYFNVPLVCYFELSTNFPYINKRNFTFLLQGINDFKRNAEKLGIKLIVNTNSNLLKISEKAVEVITDRGYLLFHKNRDKDYSQKMKIPYIQIETNVIVPIEQVSNKQEYGAYTIRPKIQKHLHKYLTFYNIPKLKIPNLDLKFESIETTNITKLIYDLKIDNSVTPTQFIGGETQALKYLDYFVKTHLSSYEQNRNNANLNATSNLSPYLHFGHISPVLIAVTCLKHLGENNENIKSFFNELIIWRELARNYCYYNQNYNKDEGLPNWTIQNFKKTINDKREFLYSLSQFENAKTHDQLWNSAQVELVKTGKIHGVMRMYWGKKVIEWSKNPKYAHKVLIHLNDKYSIDGRDENGYAGINWCFGLHDKPFFRRNIFGIVRYMAESGIKKKFNTNEYIKKFS